MLRDRSPVTISEVGRGSAQQTERQSWSEAGQGRATGSSALGPGDLFLLPRLCDMG